MNKTKSYSNSNKQERLLVDTTTLMEILQSGRQTATSIGTAANARVTVGRRVFWKVSKINEYLESLAR